MEIFKTCLTSLGSISALFVLMKILGNRQMSQLTMFDYINGITIGSMAAEMATSLDDNFLKPLVAMLIYTFVILFLSKISQKSIKARKKISDKSFILYKDGKLIYENFKKSKLDITEFLTQCRLSGFFNIADLETAILEANGNISFLPLSNKRFVTPSDLNIPTQPEKFVFNVIMDGEIIDENLNSTGNTKEWLESNLKKQNISNLSNIFLATCDSNNNLSIYTK